MRKQHEKKANENNVLNMQNQQNTKQIQKHKQSKIIFNSV
jgi:hypothetical protein